MVKMFSGQRAFLVEFAVSGHRISIERTRIKRNRFPKIVHAWQVNLPVYARYIVEQITYHGIYLDLIVKRIYEFHNVATVFDVSSFHGLS